MNQHPIVEVEVSSFFNMKCASFMFDAFEDVMDMLVYYRHIVKRFFCSGRVEFVVVIKVNSVLIKTIETSIWGGFVGSGGHSIVGKFCKR